MRPYRSRKIIVAGAGGQLGRALLSCVPEPANVVGLTHAELDISDAAAVMNLAQSQRPDLIICAAAYTAMDRAESQPELAALINVVRDSHALLDALALTPCHWRTHLRAVIREMSHA